MRRERWDQISEVFHRAFELDGAERERFVAEVCGEDDALRREVVALLAAHAAGPLDALAADLPRQIRAALPGDLSPGARIGPYRLVDRIGQGGMGVVYLARREEADFEQRVALKLLRGGLDAPELIDRFLTERRVLARLQHNHITRLLDGGLTPDGVPFLAMEYVDGEPIHQYCERMRLGVHERLRLFLAVCDAMQYAHRHLIVHRDVKPSNILVTDDGTVKVLDFGIAKLLDDPAAPGVTRTGQRWLTPEYASPEQVRGEPVTTASDVYALGVVLYELLVGRRPYQAEGRRRHEIEQAVLESEPSRPSAALAQSAAGADRSRSSTDRSATARLRRQLAGDLDTIVLKSLQKAPERRYAMAGELADDLRRHLVGLPVRARPDTLRYRAGKFARRHRTGVTAAALLATTLVMGAAATAWQARRAMRQAWIATEQRDRASAEAAKAEQVAAFLTDLFKASSPGEALGREVTARELLEHGATRLRDDGELAAQPVVRADLLFVLGQVYTDLGWRAEARGVLEEVLDLRRQHLPPNDTAIADALIQLANLDVYDGRPAAARRRYEQALDALRAAPDSVARFDLATVLNGLAAVHLANAAHDTAETLLREAIALRRGRQGEIDELAENLNGLGVILSRSGEFEAADSFYVEALAIQRQRLDPMHPDLARSLNNLGLLKQRKGEAAAAEPYLRQALEIWREVLGRHPDVAMALNNLGSSLETQGKLDQAEAAYRESLTLKRALIAGDHPSITYSLNNLGLVLGKLGRDAEAEPLLEESLAIRRRLYGEGHPDVAGAYHNIAALNERNGALARAVHRYERAFEIRRERLAPAHRFTLASALALARVKHARGEATDAADLLGWLIEIGTPERPPGDSLLAAAHDLLEIIDRGVP